MKSRALTRWRISFSLTLYLLSILSGLSVDPPPPYVLNAPQKQQLQYAEEISAASERERAKIARERFTQKEARRQEIFAALQSELHAEQARMAAQASFAGDTQASNREDQSRGVRVLPSAGRVFWGILLIGGLTLIYLARDRLLWSAPSTRNPQR